MRFEPETVLVTGGAGFIGSHLVRQLLRERAVRVVVLDLLTYAGNLENLADVAAEHGTAGDGRYAFVHGDVRDHGLLERLLAGTYVDPETGATLARPDAVLHLAAETHVDRSIIGAAPFVATNVQGTVTLLDALRTELVRRPRSFRFVNVGTDEVYGSLDATQPPLRDDAPLRPNGAYAASKAAGDCFVRAYVQTHDLPAVLVRCTNNYGPHQFPEKLIPLMIVRALRDEPLPVYGDGRHVRDWIHVEDHTAALIAVLERGRPGVVYHVSAECELRNLEVVQRIVRLLGKPERLIRFVEDRAGHDRRYALDARRLREELGWRPVREFDTGLEATVAWYLEHRAWWERMLERAG